MSTVTMDNDRISAVFLTHAAGALGDTDLGATGQDIVTITSAYAADGSVELPHPSYPIEINKRTVLYENLMALPPRSAYQALLDLCENKNVRLRNAEEATKLKMTLVARYGHLSDLSSERSVSHGLISGTQQWLDSYPNALALYNEALAKYEAGVSERNCLDDLRLALELLVRTVLSNEKSLENQIQPLGIFLKNRGGSPEFRNMFVKLVEYYAKYQNTYVKHNDAVLEEEIEFTIEMTSSFAKHLVRIAVRNGE